MSGDDLKEKNNMNFKTKEFGSDKTIQSFDEIQEIQESNIPYTFIENLPTYMMEAAQYKNLAKKLDQMIKEAPTEESEEQFMTTTVPEETVKDEEEVQTLTLNSATGIKELDELLDGGFPKGACVLLAGSSGGGKTIFTFQWLFEGYKNGENGVYITLTEPLFKILENLEKMNYYSREAIEQEKIKIVDLRQMYDAGKFDPEEILKFVEKTVKESNAKRLCIDSITAIAYHLNDKSMIRTFIFELGTILATLGCTTVLTSEVADETKYSIYEVEEFISDAILRVDQIRVKDEFQRTFKIAKIRGKSYVSESFPMKISADGIQIFPKIRPQLKQSVSTKRVSCGNNEIDDMLHGGLIKGSTNLLVGSTGSGKTLLCLQYILDGLKKGEPCLYAGFEESSQQLIRNAKSFGWDLKKYEKNGLLNLLVSYPCDKLLEEHFTDIKKIVVEKKIKRCVVDSLAALSHDFDSDQFYSFVIRLNGFMKSYDITNLFTTTTGTLIGTSTITREHLSTLTDCIIMLRYVEMEGKLESVVNVLKMRGSSHCKDLRRYEISDNGLTILESLSGYEGVMTGSSKKIRELEEESERLRNIIEEKERTENQLRIVSNAIEQSPSSIVITDLNGKIEYVNPAFETLTGYKKIEAIGKDPSVLKSGKHDKAFYNELWDTIESGRIWAGTFENKKKNGELFFEQATIAPVTNTEGEITHFVAVKEDITEKLEAEKVLEQSHKETELILDSAADGLRIVGKDFNVKKLNNTMAEMVGLKKEKCVGMNCQKMFAEKHFCKTKECSLVKVLKTGKSFQRESSRITSKGKVIPTLEKVSPYFDSDGNIVGIIEDFRDITEIKQAEKIILENEKRFKDITYSVADWIWEVDISGRYTYTSNNVKKILGYEPREILGKKPFDFMPDDEAKRVGDIFLKLTKNKEKIIDLENWNISKSGEKKCLLTNGVPIFNEQKKLIGYRGVDKDITDWKNSEIKIKESEQKFRVLFDASRDAIMTLAAPSWKFTSGNPATLKLFNIQSEKDLISKTPWDVSPKHQPNGQLSAIAGKQMINKALKEGSAFFEWQHKRSDGSEFPSNVLLTRVEIEKGKPFLQATMRDITQIKKVNDEIEARSKALAEANVRASNLLVEAESSKKEIESILDTVADGIRIVGKDFKVKKLNNRMAQMADISVDEGVGMHCDDMLKSVDCGTKGCSLLTVMKTGEGFEREVVKQRKDGTNIPFLLSAQPYKDETGKIIGIIEDFRDISDLKQKEVELRKNEKFFRQFFEASPDYCYIVSPKGEIMDINIHALEVLGKDKSKIVGKQIIPTVYASSSKNQAIDLVNKWRKEGKLRNEEINIKSKKGERTVLLSVDDIKDENGKIEYSILMQKDITEMKQAQDELKHTKNDIEIILNSAADGIRIVGKDFKVKNANETMAKLADVSINKCIGMSCQEMFGDKHLCQTKNCSLVKALKTGKSFQRESLRKTKSGKTIPVLEKITPYRNGEGEIIGIIEDFRDISDIKKGKN